MNVEERNETILTFVVETTRGRKNELKIIRDNLSNRLVVDYGYSDKKGRVFAKSVVFRKDYFLNCLSKLKTVGDIVVKGETPTGKYATVEFLGILNGTVIVTIGLNRGRYVFVTTLDDIENIVANGKGS